MSDKLHPTRKRTPGAKREAAIDELLSSFASSIERAVTETSGVGTVCATLKIDSNGGVVYAAVKYEDFYSMK